jgi:hypothetical protein
MAEASQSMLFQIFAFIVLYRLLLLLLPCEHLLGPVVAPLSLEGGCITGQLSANPSFEKRFCNLHIANMIVKTDSRKDTNLSSPMIAALWIS